MTNQPDRDYDQQDTEQKSLEERVAALEKRCADLEEQIEMHETWQRVRQGRENRRYP